ncbi:MAG TPA: hypothetical protein DCP87_00620 [Lactobacillus sp.]|nr:hypothetical protein [Lactobacillus sp.]
MNDIDWMVTLALAILIVACACETYVLARVLINDDLNRNSDRKNRDFFNAEYDQAYQQVQKIYLEKLELKAETVWQRNQKLTQDSIAFLSRKQGKK